MYTCVEISPPSPTPTLTLALALALILTQNKAGVASTEAVPAVSSTDGQTEEVLGDNAAGVGVDVALEEPSPNPNPNPNIVAIVVTPLRMNMDPRSVARPCQRLSPSLNRA